MIKFPYLQKRFPFLTLYRDAEGMDNKTIRDIAIERCAQLADDEADRQYDEGKAKILRKAATAIRALKDQP